ncbi:cell division protein FtsL [Vagococcus entomophilus]|uniref:Cell division protein FtsL n=2 Tax=Vagococcus entomophilus TaxID=1160095 RepID=A0A430AIT6_9ENTE|nr:cell division protein FtsL [Vagococcus entomophilus]RSU07827.1 hypothetical protein CBF30_00885 [Vagococcus entomophilus]
MTQMAQIKKTMDEYQVDVPSEAKASFQDEMASPFQLSEKRIKGISRLEKITIGGIVLMCIVLAMTTIYMSTVVNKETESITNTQQEIERTTNSITKLQQEKSELSRKDRVKSIADKASLKQIEGNIRTVTK